ncbi:hypothetical protein GCM10027290_61550 [Micromonospora sonneratiae]|uniref:Uncharacterized protein n=1 Tax=Micromonospora sonneratiae TaxID=1184706 RepID=A0ABW3YJ78_9ACTN
MAEEKVTASPRDIRLLGIKFIDWSETLDGLALEAEAAMIRPGSVEPGAEALKKRYGTRVNTDLVKLLVDLSKVFYDTGQELLKLADVYEQTDEINKNDLDRLMGMIKSISKTYPEYSPLPVDDIPKL